MLVSLSGLFGSGSDHGVDGFVGQNVLVAGIVLDQLSVLHGEASAYAVDLFVDLALMAGLGAAARGLGLDSSGTVAGCTTLCGVGGTWTFVSLKLQLGLEEREILYSL